MSPGLIEPVVAAIARRTGIPARGILESAEVLRVEPADVTRTGSFAVELRTGWRSAEAAFVPGRFAKAFVRHLGQAASESRLSFAALAGAPALGKRLTVRVNGRDFHPDDSAWPADWKDFELVLRRPRIVPEELSPREMKSLLAELAVPVFGMVVVLAGVDGVDADDSALEGDSSETVSRRYERKPINREICLALKGRRCWCCGIDFGDTYGPEAEGMIEVHHRVPVSGMGPGYRVHPVRDLFPLCGNCHSVVHLAKPPRDPDELRRRLQSGSPRK